MKETQWRVAPELRLLNLHFFNICRHHPTLKFKPHATDDERYVSGIDGVPLRAATLRGHSGHTGFPSVALEIKLQMEHCMPVILSCRVRVDFNIPGRPTQPRENPPTKPLTGSWSVGDVSANP